VCACTKERGVMMLVYVCVGCVCVSVCVYGEPPYKGVGRPHCCIGHVAQCCSVLRCVAACCGVLRCVAVHHSVLHCVCDAVCCSVLKCMLRASVQQSKPYTLGMLQWKFCSVLHCVCDVVCCSVI